MEGKYASTQINTKKVDKPTRKVETLWIKDCFSLFTGVPIYLFPPHPVDNSVFSVDNPAGTVYKTPPNL